jgi:hypothetical protein
MAETDDRADGTPLVEIFPGGLIPADPREAAQFCAGMFDVIRALVANLAPHINFDVTDETFSRYIGIHERQGNFSRSLAMREAQRVFRLINQSHKNAQALCTLPPRIDPGKAN